MKRAYVDTNVILRFLTGTPPHQAEEAKRLFEAAERGEVTLILDEIVLAEVVWVLSSFYKFNKSTIRDVLQSFVMNPGIEMQDKVGALLALTLFADLNIDFEDALVSVHMNRDHVREIFTFDKHFDRLPGINRLTPGRMTRDA